MGVVQLDITAGQLHTLAWALHFSGQMGMFYDLDLAQQVDDLLADHDRDYGRPLLIER